MQFLRNYRIPLLIGICFIAFHLAHAQCDELPWEPQIEMETWREEYSSLDWVTPSDCEVFIQADSILAGYMSTKENAAYNASGCCFLLATKFAEKEMASLVNILLDSLEKEDSERFLISQNRWSEYYNSEAEFLKKTYISYSNFRKYDLGRYQNFSSLTYKYYMVKDRILLLRGYINDLSFDKIR